MRGGSGLGAGSGRARLRLRLQARVNRRLHANANRRGTSAPRRRLRLEAPEDSTADGLTSACLAQTTISTIATMIHAIATTAMIHQVLSCSMPAITATAMMNPASIRNREPTTGTSESYGCCSSCDSPEGAEPSD